MDQRTRQGGIQLRYRTSRLKRLKRFDNYRRAEVLRLRRTGMSFPAIGERLGVTRQRVHQIYWAALREIPVQEVTDYRAEQLERLDALPVKANEVLERHHITVSNGRVVTLDGEPLQDAGPLLDAIKTVLDIETRRAKLMGLNTPVKQQLQTEETITYAFEGVD
ncbi:helix-turn-helix domain-containing protein [Nonomuraea sp. NPDC048892]|uniref:helix-turn-helix domain-containing protein n=1 Tax=Nonomuraea sp. NPDC048892 TaxID=3154624 RepID=UPI00340B2F26